MAAGDGTWLSSSIKTRHSPRLSIAGAKLTSVDSGVRLTDEERLDWLRLIRSENVGPRGIMAQTPQA
jgi:hypothetical protein